MSRQLRKLQKDKELEIVEADSDNDVVQPPKQNLFALLEQETLPSGGSESEKPEKTNIVPQTTSKKKKKKKKRADIDEVEKAIEEVNAKMGQVSMENHTVQSDVQENLFRLEKRFFDSEAELYREFRMGSKSKNKIRGIVSKKEGWPLVPSFGATMSLVLEDQGIKYFEIFHSDDYEAIQKTFYHCVQTHNPQLLMDLLRQNPFHLDALLQMSEVFKGQDEIQTASDYVQRCLYCLEQTFHHNFKFQQGDCRLLYDIPENRILHLALFRHIDYVSRLGCWRSALELQKLLYSLDPEFDPLCAYLGLHVLAIKSGEYEWGTKLFCSSTDQTSFCPGGRYSFALCKWEMERERGFNHESSSLELKRAICEFPSIMRCNHV
jgi:hypothetical protein